MTCIRTRIFVSRFFDTMQFLSLRAVYIAAFNRTPYSKGIPSLGKIPINGILFEYGFFFEYDTVDFLTHLKKFHLFKQEKERIRKIIMKKTKNVHVFLEIGSANMWSQTPRKEHQFSKMKLMLFPRRLSLDPIFIEPIKSIIIMSGWKETLLPMTFFLCSVIFH